MKGAERLGRGRDFLDIKLREGDVSLMFGVEMALGKVECAWLGSFRFIVIRSGSFWS